MINLFETQLLCKRGLSKWIVFSIRCTVKHVNRPHLYRYEVVSHHRQLPNTSRLQHRLGCPTNYVLKTSSVTRPLACIVAHKVFHQFYMPKPLRFLCSNKFPMTKPCHEVLYSTNWFCSKLKCNLHHIYFRYISPQNQLHCMHHHFHRQMSQILLL